MMRSPVGASRMSLKAKPAARRKATKPKVARKAVKAVRAGAKSTTRPSSKAPKAQPASKVRPASQPLQGQDWRTATLEQVRRLIRAADPDVVEEVKWVKPSNPAGVPTWSHDGILCTGETYKDKVKLTFVRGAALQGSTTLFNAADTGATRRAIDLREGDTLDEAAFKALVKAAVELNTGSKT